MKSYASSLKAIKEKYIESIDKKIEDLKPLLGETGLPHVAFIKPFGDKAAESYINSKRNIFRKLGVPSIVINTPEDADNAYMSKLVNDLNEVKIPSLIQLPLAKGLDENVIQGLEDGLDLDRLAKIALMEQNTGDVNILYPCTAAGVLVILLNWIKEKNIIPDFEAEPDIYPYGLNNKLLAGIPIAVIGRGSLSGRPISRMLQDLGATVKCLNSLTDPSYIKEVIRESKIVVSCTGNHGIIVDHMYEGITEPRLLIDVGVYVDENGKVHGDLDKKVSEVADKLRIELRDLRDKIDRAIIQLESPEISAYQKMLLESQIVAMKEYATILSQRISNLDTVSGENGYYTPSVGGVGPMTVYSVAFNYAELLNRKEVREDIMSVTDKVTKLTEKGYDISKQ